MIITVKYIISCFVIMRQMLAIGMRDCLRQPIEGGNLAYQLGNHKLPKKVF